MTNIRRMLTALSLACGRSCAPAPAALVLLSIGLLSCALSACGPSPEEQREPPAVKDTAFGDMVGTMDRARGVEDTTMQHKEDVDRSLDEAEGER